MLGVVLVEEEGRVVLGGQTDRPEKIASAEEWGEGHVQRESVVLHLCSPEEIDMMPFAASRNVTHVPHSQLHEASQHEHIGLYLMPCGRTHSVVVQEQ